MSNKYLLRAEQNGKQVDAVYIDFTKALDEVNHCILMERSESFLSYGQFSM